MLCCRTRSDKYVLIAAGSAITSELRYADADDPDLFGGMFDTPSWDPWLAFLEALQALPMSDGHLALYRHHTGRAAPPTKPARYAELVVGRRGGKSRILALIAT